MSTDTTDTTVTDAASSGGPARRSLPHRLYHGETHFDFWGRRWWGFGLSILLCVVSVISLVFSGLNLGIDFEGGVAWRVPATPTLGVDEAKQVLTDNGLDADHAKVQVYSEGDTDSIRLEVDDQPPEVRQKVAGDLATKAGVESSEVSVSSVSSSWGRSITEKAVRALVVFLLLVVVYITWRLEWRMAVGAIIAVLHDVLVSVGVYSVLGFEVTPATVIAFLTILGFSLYDTIVVYDKVHEVEERYKGRRQPYADIVNVATNNVLMRSLNTTLAAVLPVASLLIVGAGLMGATALREFALALLVGLLAGSYSSIFIASMMVGVLKNHDPRYRSLASAPHKTGDDLERLVLATVATAAPLPTSESAGDRPADPAAARARATAPSGFTHPPRPRKKRRR